MIEKYYSRISQFHTFSSFERNNESTTKLLVDAICPNGDSEKIEIRNKSQSSSIDKDAIVKKIRYHIERYCATRFFLPGLFYHKAPPGALFNALKLFRICFRICRNVRIRIRSSAVALSAGTDVKYACCVPCFMHKQFLD
jgi:hypothetical protein